MRAEYLGTFTDDDNGQDGRTKWYRVVTEEPKGDTLYGLCGAQILDADGCPLPEGGNLMEVRAAIAKAETAEANANLQAAAPDLLAALEWVAQEIEWGHDMAASAAILSQAIAQAEGDTP